jgi:hypothetical protein
LDILANNKQQVKDVKKEYKLKLVEFADLKEKILEIIHQQHVAGGLSKRRVANFESSI